MSDLVAWSATYNRIHFGDALPLRLAGCFQCDALSRVGVPLFGGHEGPQNRSTFGSQENHGHKKVNPVSSVHDVFHNLFLLAAIP